MEGAILQSVLYASKAENIQETLSRRVGSQSLRRATPGMHNATGCCFPDWALIYCLASDGPCSKLTAEQLLALNIQVRQDISQYGRQLGEDHEFPVRVVCACFCVAVRVCMLGIGCGVRPLTMTCRQHPNIGPLTYSKMVACDMPHEVYLNNLLELGTIARPPHRAQQHTHTHHHSQVSSSSCTRYCFSSSATR